MIAIHIVAERKIGDETCFLVEWYPALRSEAMWTTYKYVTATLKQHWGQLRGEAIQEAYSDEVLESMAVFQMRALLTQVQLKLQHYRTHRADKSSPFIKASSSFASVRQDLRAQVWLCTCRELAVHHAALKNRKKNVMSTKVKIFTLASDAI